VKDPAGYNSLSKRVFSFERRLASIRVSFDSFGESLRSRDPTTPVKTDSYGTSKNARH